MIAELIKTSDICTWFMHVVRSQRVKPVGNPIFHKSSANYKHIVKPMNFSIG